MVPRSLPPLEEPRVSHIMTVKTRLHDPAACKRLNLDPPIGGVAQLFAGAAAGLLVRLPEWRYPCPPGA